MQLPRLDPSIPLARRMFIYAAVAVIIEAGIIVIAFTQVMVHQAMELGSAWDTMKFFIAYLAVMVITWRLLGFHRDRS